MSDDKTMDILINKANSHDEKLDKILEQVVRTNGRVTAHDTMLTELKNHMHSPDDCQLGKTVAKIEVQQKGISKMLSWTLGVISSLLAFLLGVAFGIIKIG